MFDDRKATGNPGRITCCGAQGESQQQFPDEAPAATPEVEHDPDETVIVIPLKDTDESGYDEIARGLGGLGASALLFLRQIEEIHWSVEGGRSGHYLRESEEIEEDVRRVTVIGQEQGQPEIDEEWLVISQAVPATDGASSGKCC